MISGVPLIRDLKRCRRTDYSEAAKEVVGTFLLAIIPIWLGAVVMLLIPSVSVTHYVSDFFVSGESLLVSAALIGPGIYVITKRYGDLPKSFSIHFPQGWFLIIISLVICMITAAIFGLQKGYAQFFPKPQPPLFDANIMQNLSVGVLIATVITIYVLTVFKNFAEEGAAAEMRSDEEDFLQQWRAQKKVFFV